MQIKFYSGFTKFFVEYKKKKRLLFRWGREAFFLQEKWNGNIDRHFKGKLQRWNAHDTDWKFIP